MKQFTSKTFAIVGGISLLSLFSFKPSENAVMEITSHGGCPTLHDGRYPGGLSAYTGSVPDGPYTCLNCHGGGAATPTVNMTVSPSFVNNTYVPGQTYTITYNVTGYSYYGFDLEINDGNTSSSTVAGSFSNPSSNCVVHPTTSIHSPSNVSHSQRISSSSVATFNWTAPTNATNSLYLFSVGLGVNGNGSTGGDNMVSHNLILTPAATLPTSSFSTQSNTTTYCAGTAIQLVNNSSNATSYNWSSTGGGFSSSTAANPTVTFPTSGTYTVTLTATGSGGSSTSSQTFTIVAQPTSQFSASSTNVTLPNATVNFTNQSNGATSYLWDFGDGNTSTAVNPSHTYTSSGTYTVSLIASNANCQGSSYTSTIVVSNVNSPTSSFTTQSNTTTYCAGETIQLVNNSSNATSYSWSANGGVLSSSTATNPTVIFQNSGTYSVTLVAVGSGGSHSSSQTFTILTQPISHFTVVSNSLTLPNATAYFTNQSSGATSYLWDFGDGNTSTATNPFHNYTSVGTYQVELISSNNVCPNDTSLTNITVSSNSTTLIKENELFSSLELYPNPIIDKVSLKFNLTKEAFVSVNLINPNGQKVASLSNGFRIAGEQQITFIIDESLPKGIYFVQLVIENKSVMKEVLLR